MYSTEKFNFLKDKYSRHASWAIWDEVDMTNTLVIEDNVNQLQSNYVLVALNFSTDADAIIEPWFNFHGGSKHDRKLRRACNNTELRGSYMTDLFKNVVEVKSTKLKNILTPEVIELNVNSFMQEMKDVELDDSSTFVVWGTENSDTAKFFSDYFRPNFDNKAVFYYHYSYYGMTDEAWVKGLWSKLNIKT